VISLRYVMLVILIFVNTLVNASTLEEVLEKKYIQFAFYENFPPFSYEDESGKIVGIDVDIAQLVADKLEVKLGKRLLAADESVDDDLRNGVWKGHFTAGGPSDVMMHIPYDPAFARANDKVAFLQPYFKELIAFAVNTYRIKNSSSLEAFFNDPIGVETATLADAYLLGAHGGKLRDNVKHYVNIAEAVKAMVDNEVYAVMATRSEIEFNLKKYDQDFLVTKLPTPGLTLDGWTLCAAVKADNVKLAKRLNEIFSELKASGDIERVFKSYGLNFKEASEKEIITPYNAQYAIE